MILLKAESVCFEVAGANERTNPSTEDPRLSMILGAVLRGERRRQERPLAIHLPRMLPAERSRDTGLHRSHCGDHRQCPASEGRFRGRAHRFSISRVENQD